jgi:hypothetical protein
MARSAIRTRMPVCVVVSALIAGCTTYVPDLAISKVSVIRTRAPAVLNVELTTHVDLSALTSLGGVLLHSENFFCSEPGRYAVLGWSVETPATVVTTDSSAAPPIGGKSNIKGRMFIYAVPIPISRDDSPSSVPPEHGFNLEREPKDICMRLGGGYLGVSIKSNVVTLSAADIRNAFLVSESK